MGIIKRIGERQFKEGKGVEKATPKHGFKRFFILWTTYFWKSLLINLVFILTCLPIITIPASLCAINRYNIKMVRDGYGFDLGDYWKEWKSQLIKSIPYGIIVALPMVYSYYLLSIHNSGQGDFIVLAFGIFWGLFGLLLGSYVFVLLSMLDLPLGHIFKNAFILIVSDWKKSVFVLIIIAGAVVLVLSNFPVSMFVLPVGCFAWISHAICSVINISVENKIFAPFYSQYKKQEEE